MKTLQKYCPSHKNPLILKRLNKPQMKMLMKRPQLKLKDLSVSPGLSAVLTVTEGRGMIRSTSIDLRRKDTGVRPGPGESLRNEESLENALDTTRGLKSLT